MALTGKFRFRKSLWGRIVLQVEEEVQPFWRGSKPRATKRRWRDATLMDLAAPDMRPLIDMRFRAQLRYQSLPPSEVATVPSDEPPSHAAAHVPIPQAKGDPQRTAH